MKRPGAGLAPGAARLKQMIRDKLVERNEHIRENGQDLPEIRNWSGRTDRGDPLGRRL